MKDKWYKKTIPIILLLIFFFPVGLFLMWKYTAWNNKVKWGVSVFWAIFTFLYIIGTTTSSQSTTSGYSQSKATQTATNTPTSAPSKTPTPSSTLKPTATPTSSPTPTTKPTPTLAHDSHGFPEDYQQVTVADMSKTPSQYNNQTVMFNCSVDSFARDSAGDVTAANCSDPNDPTSIAQVDISIFDVSKINQSDSIYIYGTGEGALTGKNAYGASVTVAGVAGVYIDDVTSGYSNSK